LRIKSKAIKDFCQEQSHTLPGFGQEIFLSGKTPGKYSNILLFFNICIENIQKYQK